MKTRAAGGAALLVLIALPAFLSSYQLSLLTKMLIFGIFAMSLDLLLGYTGLPSLGHAAYFGVASYTVALLALKGPGSFWLQVGAALVLAALAAALFGLLALSLSQVVINDYGNLTTQPHQQKLVLFINPSHAFALHIKHP